MTSATEEKLNICIDYLQKIHTILHEIQHSHITTDTKDTINCNETMNRKEIPSYYIAFDGASRGNPGISGCGGYIYSIDKDTNQEIEIKRFNKFLGTSTNNVAEYNGLLLGIQTFNTYCNERNINKKGISLTILGDSKLVIQQMQGLWKIKNDKIKNIYNEIMKYIHDYDTDSIQYKHVYRTFNTIADELANDAINMYYR